ncbi:hypothetical protein Tco_0455670 [Tanacetum coccineum]
MIPPWEMKNPFRTLEITPNQAFGAPGIPLKPPRREQRNLVLFDPTPSKRTAKLRNDILMFQTTSWRIFIRSMDSFQGFTPKSPSSWHRPLAPTRSSNSLWISRCPSHPTAVNRLENQPNVDGSLSGFNKLTQVNLNLPHVEICNGPHDTHNYMEGLEQSCVDYASSNANKISDKRFISNQGLRSFNDATNTWMDKPNFNWERTQTLTNLQNESISIHSSSYQINLEKALLDLDSNQEKRLSHLRTQLEQQQDNMIGKINLFWKTVSEKLNDASPLENAGNSMAPKIIAAIRHDEKEELKKKGIKSLSKLLSPKYLSLASIKELNKNPSSPKRVHFVNSIIILSTDSDTEEEDDSSTNVCDLNLGSMVKEKEEVKKKGKEEDKMEADMEVEEVIEEEEIEFKTDEEVKEIFEEEEEDEDDENFNSFLTMRKLSHHEWQTKLMGLSIDSIPLFFHEENFGHGRTHYYQSLLIGDEYKQDESDKKGIRHLMRLYLMRRSLEVLRKFHWMILRGQFNQLSHVSSLLLSKPWEY